MQQAVIFENKGPIDIRSIKTFGVSAKEGTNPIGYFGTGLKYAIAILLRTGHKMKIHSDGETFEFGIKPSVIRNKAFEVLTINNEELPFTTELGKNWQTWQAFREVYCNCIDESGSIALFQGDLNFDSKGKTIVEISGRDAIQHYYDRDSIVLKVDSDKIIYSGSVEVHTGKSWFVYYRGIRVLPLNKESYFTYNVTREQELTEDRTLKTPSMALRYMVEGVANLKDRVAIREIITGEKYFESSLDFSLIDLWGIECSEEFIEVAGDLFDSNTDRINPSVRAWYRSRKNKTDLKNFQPEKMNSVEDSQLKKVIKICEKSLRGFNIDDIEILIVKNLGEATMALAEIDAGRIIISKKAFSMGTKFLLSTFIEEWLHIKSGRFDLTREFQTAIFDMAVDLIEDHVLKEPV